MTPKQAMFVREYLVDLNATQAAIRAGYALRTASSQGARLLNTPGVAEAVREALMARAERTQVTADRVVAELARVAFGDIRKLFEDGRPVPIDQLPPEVAAMVAGLDVVTRGGDTVAKLKRADKLRALELLGRHLGLFLEQNENKDGGGTPPALVVRFVDPMDEDKRAAEGKGETP